MTLKEDWVAIVTAIVGWIGGVLSFAWRVSAKLSRLETMAIAGEEDRKYLRQRIDDLFDHILQGKVK